MKESLCEGHEGDDTCLCEAPSVYDVISLPCSACDSFAATEHTTMTSVPPVELQKYSLTNSKQFSPQNELADQKGLTKSTEHEEQESKRFANLVQRGSWRPHERHS